jgi:DNA-directed RNA polymerase specialized sigma24 family protein
VLDRAELRRLMERLADGDRTAVGPAFALLWPQLRSFAVRLAGEDGEDAAQAAILKVFSRASDYDRERDALAWALGIAAWECRTLRKRRERRREESALAPALADTSTLSPEAAVVERDLREAAEAVLGTLRPIDIETIAAAASGRREQGATFRKRLERALARFRLAWRARHGNE